MTTETTDTELRINIVVPEDTDEATRDLVQRAVVGALQARDEYWATRLQLDPAAAAAIAAVRATLPELVAAINSPKVQRIEHDDAGRIVQIVTTTAA